MKTYSIWAHPVDTELMYLKSIEQKWEIGGFLLGPIWIVVQKGPLPLALFIFVLVMAPLFIFGVNTFTIFWALILWTFNARSHAGLQARRLTSIGYVRLGEIHAESYEDAEEQFRRSRE